MVCRWVGYFPRGYLLEVIFGWLCCKHLVKKKLFLFHDMSDPTQKIFHFQTKTKRIYTTHKKKLLKCSFFGEALPSPWVWGRWSDWLQVPLLLMTKIAMPAGTELHAFFVLSVDCSFEVDQYVVMLVWRYIVDKIITLEYWINYCTYQWYLVTRLKKIKKVFNKVSEWFVSIVVCLSCLRPDPH